MPKSSIETVQEFAFAGYFSPRTLIVAGVVVAVLVCVMTWRESKVSRPLLAPMLLVLRLIAAAVVLWILAGPTVLTKVRQTHPKSVAVVVDTSGSMGVVDAAGDSVPEPSMLRWAALPDAPEARQLLTKLDGGAAMAAMARNLLAQLVQDSGASKPLQQMQTCVSRSRLLVEKTAADLKESIATPATVGEAIRQTLTTLTASVLPALAELNNDLEKGGISQDAGRTERISDVIGTLDQIATRLASAADAVANGTLQGLAPAARDRMRAQLDHNRLDFVSTWLREAQGSWIARLEEKTRLMRYRFDGAVTPVGEWGDVLAAANPVNGVAKPQAADPPAPSTHMATNLAGALETVARDAARQPIEAVLIVTDGAHNAESDPLKVASAIGNLPVYVVPIGQTKPLRDVMIHHVQGPRAAFKNDFIVIEGTIDAYGCSGEELLTDLLDADHADAVLETQKLTSSSDSFVHPFTFRHKAEAIGTRKFRVRVHPLPDERVKDNNEAQLSVEVTEDKIRVLVADHLPRWEHRYLRNLFKRDERVLFDELLFEPARSDGAPAVGQGLPHDLDDWSRYRIAVLGDLGPTYITTQQQQMIEQYVNERGGTLILIAGEEAMPAAYANQTLGLMIPVESANTPPGDGAFNLYVTAEGGQLPVTQLMDDPIASERLWREQMPIYHLSAYSQPKPTSHVWIGASASTTNERPQRADYAFLCWQSYGRGRVVYLSAPMTYRLRYRYGDRYHHRFWGQLLRWAIAPEVAGGSKTVHLSTDKTHYIHGEAVEATVRLNRLNGEAVAGEADCRVVAKQDNRIVASVNMTENPKRPGEYRNPIKGLPTGPVTLTVVSAQALLDSESRTEPVQTVVVVDPEDELEMRNTRCNLPLLTQIAKSTGGLVVPPTAVEAVVSQLDLQPAVSEQISQRPLWTRWVFLWIFVACLTAEWVVRKLGGLA